MRRLILAASVAALTTGCALTPDYERPELDVPTGFQAQESAGPSIANLEWWELFGDEALQNLIRTALEENKDLGVALSRLAEARSALTITRADQLPFIDVTGRAGRVKQSEDLVPGSGARGDYGLAAEVSYELDLWGQLRRATEEEKQRQIANLRDLQNRNRDKTEETLAKLKKVAVEGGNIFAQMMETARYASLGQISQALYEVGGQYRRNM